GRGVAVTFALASFERASERAGGSAHARRGLGHAAVLLSTAPLGPERLRPDPAKLMRWLVAVSVGIVLVLVGAYFGLYGSLSTCGADVAPLCVQWPAPLAASVWLGFVAFLAI